MKTVVLIALIVLVSGCGGQHKWVEGNVKEVRYNERVVRWGVWEEKEQEEVKGVAVVLDLDCGGTLVVSGYARSAWLIYRKGDRVRARMDAFNGQRWTIEGIPTCSPEEDGGDEQ